LLVKNYVIYCDPPYENARQEYYNENGEKLIFNSDKFWEWCRKMSENNIVFVSGYSAPRDFTKIWSKNMEKLYYI
jgi:site-specific DNA-adenine methylase